MALRKSSISDEVMSHIHENCLNIKDRIIYTHSYFHQDDWDLDFRQAVIFQKNIDFLNSISHDPIIVKINSPGGCYYSGFMMYDVIKSSEAHITTHTYSIGASMGSIIPQAADLRLIAPNAAFMVHKISYHDEGDIIKMKSGVDFAQKQMQSMFNVYAERCVEGKYFKNKKMTVGEVAAFIEEKLSKTGDWWLTAEEAVNYGFMDGVL